MRDHRRREEGRRGETLISPPFDWDADPFGVEIPLLLVPEGIVFEVSASLLVGPLSVQADDPPPSGAVLKRICTRLGRSWMRSWEY